MGVSTLCLCFPPRVVKPLEHRLRPRGLGLGAEVAPPGAPRAVQPSRGGEGPGGGGLSVGATVRIEAGPHRDMYGKVRDHPPLPVLPSMGYK